MTEPAAISPTSSTAADVDEMAGLMTGRRRVRFLPWLVLAIGLAATYFLQQAAFNASRQLQQEDFAYQTREIVLRMEQRLATYEEILRGFQGLYAASKSVERDEFRRYADNLHLADHFPGIQGVGFSLIIPPQEKARHIAGIRKEGFPDYSPYPGGGRDLYTAIVYLEPFSGRNLRAFGFDMYSEAVRRAAMERARDLGKSVLSGKVTLVQEVGQKVQTGFLMYLPVYRNDRPHETLAERRANIIGWVYAPFRMTDLMQGILGEQTRSLDYEIFDGEHAVPETLMYDSDGHLSLRQDSSLFHIARRLEMIGRAWTINLRSLPGFERSIDTRRVTEIQLDGTLMSVLLALLVWQLVSGRTRALSLAQDMTRKLRSSEARLLLTLKSAELGAWDWNIKAGQVVFNERWAGMRGYGYEEVEPDGQFLQTGICPDDLPLLQQKLAEHFKNDSAIFDAEYRVRTKSGLWIWLLGRGTVIERDEQGLALRMVGIEMDITDRKQTEEKLRVAATELEEAHQHLLQSDKMASIGQLAAGVAHEINNPIGYVYSNLGSLEKYVQDVFAMLALYEQAEASIADTDMRAQLAAAREGMDIGFLKDDLRALMEESREGISRVKQIVQNLKDFSHVDISDEWHLADLHRGIESTLNIVNNEIKYKAEVIREYGDLPEVECLSSQLNQVFMNLLVNAAYAIETRGTITIRTGRQGDEVWLEITDTGKGIAPEHLKKIFDPFFTTKPIGQGTGLGLSLSYGILQKHHGRIEVSSEVGRGTTFHICLPVRQPVSGTGNERL